MPQVVKDVWAACEAVLDVIVPLKARAARTKSRRFEEIPLCPAPHDLLGKRITTLMDYRDPAAQDLIRALKYDGSMHAAHLCAQAVADFLQEELVSERTFSAHRVLLVPIPLHAARKKERGFNQIGIVLERLPHEFRDGTISTLAPESLERIVATKQQTRLSRSERIKNVAGAFKAHESVSDAIVYLIDDVTTTGATLVNAGKALEKAGARVHLIALARA